MPTRHQVDSLFLASGNRVRPGTRLRVPLRGARLRDGFGQGHPEVGESTLEDVDPAAGLPTLMVLAGMAT